MKIYTLSKTESEAIIDKIRNTWPPSASLGKTKVIKVVEIDEKHQLLIAESFRAVKLGEDILPYVEDEHLLKGFPSVTVDVGAIRYVCNGADVMRPGIVRTNGAFEKNQVVAVNEEKSDRFIAVGYGLVSHKDIKTMPRGPVIKTIHYIRDKFWDTGRQVH